MPSAETAVVPPPGAHAPVTPPGKLQLRYLFGAVLEDGAQIVQTLEDVSQTIPGKNALYDLLAHDAEGNCIPHPHDQHLISRQDVVLFCLMNDAFRYLVDLRDGHFEIQHLENDKWIGAHLYLGYPPLGAKLNFFYRPKRRSHLNVTGTVQEDLTIKEEVTEIGQECEYRFGWETLDHKHRAEMILV